MPTQFQPLPNLKMAVSKKIRFEVFKRDSFTCQYCGAKAPDVVLQCDHIKPVAKGGEDDIMNLVTSCFSCNSGKSDRELSSADVIEKKRRQLESLQERKAQIEAMMDWQEGLLAIDDDVTDRVHGIWISRMFFKLNDSGYATLRALIKKHGVDHVIPAIEIAARYLRFDQQGEVEHSSAEEAFSKLPGICRYKNDPETGRLFYIRGIVRRRFNYCNDKMAISLLKDAHDMGFSTECLEDLAKTARNWTEWKDEMLTIDIQKPQDA